MLNNNNITYKSPFDVKPISNNWMKNIGNISNQSTKDIGKMGGVGDFIKGIKGNLNLKLGQSVGGNLEKGMFDYLGGSKALDLVKDSGVDKLATTGLTNLKNLASPSNLGGMAMDFAGAGFEAIGLKKMDARTATGGEKVLDFASKLPWDLIPGAGTAIKYGLQGLNLANQYFGGTSNQQGTADMVNTGYSTDTNELANAKYGLFNNKGKKHSNAITHNFNIGNMLKAVPGYNQYTNSLAAGNTSGVLRDKNRIQLQGGMGMGMLSAQKGAKINPAKLRNISNKIAWKIKSKVSTEKPKTFEEYYKSVPKDKNDTTTYNLRRAFDIAPWEDLNRFRNEEDFHLNSGYENQDTGDFEFLKSKDHKSVQLELDWFNSPDAEEYRKTHYLDDSEEYYKYKPIKHKQGGTITDLTEEKMNVIPEGAFHSRKNNMPDHIAIHVTPKGIPVVSEEEGNKFTQHAEVERNEIIFHKKATDTIEDLLKKYNKAETKKEKDQIAIECGKYISNEILVNTEDRTGIIETIK